MAATLTVGHVDNLSIGFLDQHGNPMLVTPVPDLPPVWANAPVPAGADTLTVATNGLTAVLAAVAAGADTVSLTVVVGGHTFTASDSITISAAPQVLTSVEIVDDVV